MPKNTDYPYPRRYNSLRLLGFDYSNTDALFFITMKADRFRPVFADIALAKSVLTALLDSHTLSRTRVQAYTLLPDHFHLLAGVRNSNVSLSDSLGSFKSFTTQLLWRRANEIMSGFGPTLPSQSISKTSSSSNRPLLTAITEWHASLRPESVELKNWPKIRKEHFMGKQLWQKSFHEHIIRNDADLREIIEYIAMNPVRRGYVSRAEYYPFTGFNLMDEVGF